LASTDPSPAREIYKQTLRGWWRFLIFLPVFFCTAMSGLYIPRWLDVPMPSPGAEPPWYFIRQDFFSGLGTTAGMLLLLILLAVTWRRYTVTNWILLLNIFIWMFPSAFTALIIYIRCENFFDYPNAISAWPTFNAYLKNGTKFIGIAIAFTLVVIFLGPKAWKLRKTPAR
jgi:hypothetical protein